MPVQLDIRAIREEAKGLLRTASVPPIRFTLLFLAVNLALSLVSSAATWYLGGTLNFTAANLPFSFVSVLVDLVSLVLLAGYALYCLNVQRDLETPYQCLFDAFPFAGKIILLSLLQAFLIGLGLMLFIVPGIYFALSYAFSLYHICEEPELGVIEAMRRSRMEMQGYKLQFFMLLVGFLPLLLAAALVTAGCQTYLNDALPDTLVGNLLFTLIASVLTGCVEVYLLPYLRLAQVGFYRRVTAQAAEGGADEGL